MRLNGGLISGSILLFSLIIPWTVISGTNTFSYIYSFSFYIFEFPFMSYNLVSMSGETQSWWEAYEFVPRYLGLVMMALGGVISIIGGLRKEYEGLIGWGGVLSVLALVSFTSFNSANIYIQGPLVQNYTILPLGAFIPVLFWIIVLLYPKKEMERRLGYSNLFCSMCGREVSPEFNICPFCGVKLWKPTCPSCGREASVEHNFCPFCGTRLR